MYFAGLVAALSRYSSGPRRKKRDQIAANTVAPTWRMTAGIVLIAVGVFVIELGSQAH